MFNHYLKCLIEIQNTPIIFIFSKETTLMFRTIYQNSKRSSSIFLYNNLQFEFQYAILCTTSARTDCHVCLTSMKMIHENIYQRQKVKILNLILRYIGDILSLIKPHIKCTMSAFISTACILYFDWVLIRMVGIV